jgi:hypothetical protein
MWLQHQIVSVYRNLLFEVKKTLIEELLEPKINTVTFHVYHVAPIDLVKPNCGGTLHPKCLVTLMSCHPAPL